MTFTKARFASFEAYLDADVSDLPEERCEYWDGELVPVMTESGKNDFIAVFIQYALIQVGVPLKLIRPHSCEVEVMGKPRTRFPDCPYSKSVSQLRAKCRRPAWSSKSFPLVLNLKITTSGIIWISETNTLRSVSLNIGL
jgi:hypothetical protein